MIARSVRHRGLRHLIAEDDPRGIRPDLVNRVRNILTVLILADDMDGFITAALPGWRVRRDYH